MRLPARALALTLCLLLGAAAAQAGTLRTPVGQLFGPVPLLRVVDGDTLVVQSTVGPRTVRLIGIDAPELSGEQPGARATQVNLQMLALGWAQPLPIAPNVTYADVYADAARRARSQQLGQWAPAPPERTQQAVTQADPEAPVRLHCALVNPATPNDTGEWVSVLISQPFDTRGFYVFDQGSSAVFRLPSGVQQPGQIRVTNPGQGVWNNSGDVIYLMRGGEVVDSWAYRREDAVEGRIICRDQHQDAR